MRTKVTEDMKQQFTAEVTRDEIFLVMKSMPSNKALGPDGYTFEFFKGTWEVTGDLITSAIQEFFVSGKLLKRFNAILIALIPKIPQPKRVNEFRPISLCNTIYKWIAKILAARLKKFLPKLISWNQSAFVVGSKIMDNILLAQKSSQRLFYGCWKA